jgi:hypothetical protein
MSWRRTAGTAPAVIGRGAKRSWRQRLWGGWIAQSLGLKAEQSSGGDQAMKKVPPGRLFHLTVGALPTRETAVRVEGMLDKDLLMVKAGLLYADRVRLCSVSATLVIALVALTDLTFEQQLETLKQWSSVLDLGPALLEHIHRYEFQSANPNRPIAETMWCLTFKDGVLKMWPPVAEKIAEQALKAGAQGLAEAHNTGLLELQPLKSERSPDQIREYFDVMAAALSDPSTHPLLDDLTAGLIRAGLREGVIKVSEAAVARGKSMGLAGALLSDLPLFDEASIDEIMDIRRELEHPLVGFRSGMVRFGEAIRSAAWDEDFPSDVDALYYRDVAPAVREIDEAVRSNSALRTFFKVVNQPVAPVSGSVLGWAISQTSALPAAAAAALGAGVALGMATATAYTAWKAKRVEIEQNELFFYYGVGKKLGH